MKRAGGVGLAVAVSLAVAACAGDPRVVRVYDGRIVEGPYVPPEAYAAYLKGVLAEEAGDLRSALAAYEMASREDDEDAEPLTRIGDLRCRMDPKDRAADDAFARARKIDPAYAPARAAEARCAGLRGQVGEALAMVQGIGAADRTSVASEALFVRLSAQQGARADADMRARERAIALTVASGEHVAAWEALVAWGRARGDGPLLAAGFEGILRIAPMRAAEVEAGALELLGTGHLALARRVAAAIADHPADRGVSGVRDPAVARLAIDEAILSGDETRIERRAIRGRVALAEVAARALLLERPEIAGRMARAVILADPASGGATMVIAALAAREKRPLAADLRLRSKETTDRPPSACVLVLAERLAAAGDVEAARVWLASVGRGPILAHDPVTGPLAVELAARGVLQEATLPLELRLELAARRREAPPPVDLAAAKEPALDAKHMLLFHVLVDPRGAPASGLLARLHPAAHRDPIVGFALARATLASGAAPKSDAWAPVARAIAASPAHPLLLAVAVEIAKRGGRADEVTPTQARLMAVARTPAERALARE